MGIRTLGFGEQAQLPPLERCLVSTPGLRALAVIEGPGRIKQSVGPDTDIMLKLLPFASGTGDLASRVLEAAGAGECEFHLARGEDGSLVVHRIDDTRVLIALASRKVPLGTLVHDLGLTCERLRDEGETRWSH